MNLLSLSVLLVHFEVLQDEIYMPEYRQFVMVGTIDVAACLPLICKYLDCGHSHITLLALIVFVYYEIKLHDWQC